jgi:hypothetical protein
MFSWEVVMNGLLILNLAAARDRGASLPSADQDHSACE